MIPWHENNELWAELLPVLDGDEFRKAASGQAQQAATLLRVQPGAHLLDLACGPGRHSVALAGLGFRVTGVDRNASYLARAKERAADSGVQPEFLQDSMLRFHREAAFDGAISLFSSFGYFEDRGEDLQVMRNLRASLKPGARAVVDLAGKEFLARQYATKDWHDVGVGRFWLECREVLPGWERLRVQWIFVGGGESKDFAVEIRVYSGVELREVMLQAGFAEVEIFGGLDGRPYDRDAPRLVAVGRK
jgi:SAM-dependent methyltransferase